VEAQADHRLLRALGHYADSARSRNQKMQTGTSRLRLWLPRWFAAEWRRALAARCAHAARPVFHWVIRQTRRHQKGKREDGSGCDERRMPVNGLHGDLAVQLTIKDNW